MASAALCENLIPSLRGQLLTSFWARRKQIETLSFGIAPLDTLTGGLPRGTLTEITGPASSGRTSVMMAALAGATQRKEVCALVDASDTFDPESATAAGVDLERVLWVRCADISAQKKHSSTAKRNLGRLEQVLKVTDLLLQSGGFGMVVLDLGNISPRATRRVPLTSWFRFRRAVEPTPTVLLVIEQRACATTCASLVLYLEQEAIYVQNPPKSRKQQRLGFSKIVFVAPSGLGQDFYAGSLPSHTALLHGVHLQSRLVRSWQKHRSPLQPTSASFELKIPR